jgi:hypothetical protein
MSDTENQKSETPLAPRMGRFKRLRTKLFTLKLQEVFRRNESPANDQPEGLQEYQIQFDTLPTHYWRTFGGRALMASLALRRWFSIFFLSLGGIGFWLLLILLPNGLAAAISYIYTVASTEPTSSIAAAIYKTTSSSTAFWVFQPVLCLPAVFVDYCLLLALVEKYLDAFYMRALAFVLGLSPVWLPYVVEAAVHKEVWNNDCNGYDGTIYLSAVNYGNSGPSIVEFPVNFGGQQWQLFNPNSSDQTMYEFESMTGNETVLYNMGNDTYVSSINGTVDVGSFPIRQDPLEFPQLGLSSQGNWLRACYAPAVDLRNSTGDIVLKTGLTAYTTCSYMKACVMKSSGVDAIIVAIGRILIELQAAAQCCTNRQGD